VKSSKICGDSYPPSVLQGHPMSYGFVFACPAIVLIFIPLWSSLGGKQLPFSKSTKVSWSRTSFTSIRMAGKFLNDQYIRKQPSFPTRNQLPAAKC
jgi:hypothetical protein